MKILSTKEKGDIGLTKIVSDLTEKSINVALPIAEHLPYDIIIISPEHKLARISVKYVGLVNGSIRIPVRSIGTNMKGWKASIIDFSLIEGFAVYCPETRLCYYIPRDLVKEHKSFFYLRVEKCNREQDFTWADKYLDPNIFFGL